MRKFITAILVAGAVICAVQPISAKRPKTLADTVQTESSAPKVKKGWNFGPLPAVGYNSDLGFQIGALCDIYNYGDGSKYPEYIHKFNIEASYYTKGSGVFHFFYDSKYLIPKVRLTTAITYMPNRKFPFYGFNGLSSPYNSAMDSNRDDSVAFYSMRRNLLRVLADFQGKIKGPWGWAAGVSFWWYDLRSINLKQYKSDNTLYNRYIASGIIDADEAHGGSHFEFKAGVVYDTRDHEAAPSRGIWSEVCAFGSPDIFRNKYHYLKLSAHYRQYIPVWTDRIVFAYHLAYQGLIAGRAPFYEQQNIATLYLRQIDSEGLGSINTVRGVLRNRLIGNGYAWGNFELRCRLVSFDFIKQHWYVAVNPFFDMGSIVQQFRLDRMRNSADSLIYSGKGEILHMSAGMGVKLVMNSNFIVSVEAAVPFNRQDGKYGMNIGLNYIF